MTGKFYAGTSDWHSAAIQAWETRAIEKSRNNPDKMRRLAELDICEVCMCAHPCLCDHRRIAGKMRRIWSKYHSRLPWWGSGEVSVFTRSQTRGYAYDPLTETLIEMLSVAEKELQPLIVKHYEHEKRRLAEERR